MGRRDLVVVGASAGGVEALRDLVRDLPSDLPACVCVVLHLPPAAFSALPAILSRAGSLPAFSASDGARLEPGMVLVAPPDRHLVIRDGGVALGGGPKENGHRPAVDVLFRSAARWHGSRTVGVVLSGTLDDGASGLLAIVQRGGVAVVQDPESALYPGMPAAALRAVPDAMQATGSELAHLVAKLCGEETEEAGEPAAPPEPAEDSVSGERPADRDLRLETEIPAFEEGALATGARPGKPVAMTCPSCSGAMFELEEANVVRYRCRVGHAWSPETLLFQQVEAAESALWAAIRTLEEKGALHRRLAERAGRHEVSHRYHLERAQDADQSAAVLRELLRNPLAGGFTELPHSTEASR